MRSIGADQRKGYCRFGLICVLLAMRRFVKFWTGPWAVNVAVLMHRTGSPPSPDLRAFAKRPDAGVGVYEPHQAERGRLVAGRIVA